MSQRGLSLGRATAAVLILLTAAVSAAQPAPLTGLDEYIQEAMVEWTVPGLALVIVKDGEVVYQRGFGVRDAATGEPVGPDTLFAIGSTSKAFTATALGMLADEGRLSLDDRVIDHLPWFAMYDPYATQEITLRDLLTHRSGLARGDAMWYSWGHDRREVLRRVRFLEPTRSFRSAWQYQNLMFATAGEVVNAVSGKSWDDFVEERLFRPLGMSRSVTSTRQLGRFDNVAAPHIPMQGKAVRVEHRNIDNIGPAGSIYSSVSQMSRWLRMQMAGGVFEGQRLVSEDFMKEMHSPQMLIQADAAENSLSAREARMNFNTYGLAWWVTDYRGRKVVDHGGGIDGMRAQVAFMPEEGIGLVVLSNARPNNLVVALKYRVFDHYLDGPDTDWSASMLAQLAETTTKTEQERAALEADRVQDSRPSRLPHEYAGSYGETYFGVADVLHQAGELRLSLGGRTTGRLEHWHYDVFRFVSDNPADRELFLSFRVNPAGIVDQLDIEGLGLFVRQ